MQSTTSIWKLLLSGLLLVSSAAQAAEGPFLANGLRNGWADQDSIVIWTRLTREPELKLNGVRFLELDRPLMRELSAVADPERHLAVQLPAGATLDEMEGAVPGMAGEARLSWHPADQPAEPMKTDWTAVDPDKDFTVQWKLTGLAPGMDYRVLVEARPGSQSPVSARVEGAFRTAPAATEPAAVTFVAVTCQEYHRRDDPANGHMIYDAMLKLAPDFFIHTGDIEYYDRPAPYAWTVPLMRFKMNRIFALPFQRAFFNQVTFYFIKDDHDALTNDASPGMSFGSVSFERAVELFDHEQFPSAERPYGTVRWGRDLQIWLVEGRNYRTPNSAPDGPGKTIWGPEQMDWLKRSVAESDAPFKLLISSTPIVGSGTGSGTDNYSGNAFAHEGEQVRDWIEREGLFIINGDRHLQYVSHVEGTGLWEFGTGASSDAHSSSMPAARPIYRFLRDKGGFLSVSVARPRPDAEPVIRFRHHGATGEVFHEEILTAPTPAALSPHSIH